MRYIIGSVFYYLMNVPFERLGSGQKGRLVYQVLGQGGPIPNPQNIRYLPPDAVDTASEVGPAAIGGALAVSQIFLQAAGAAADIHNAIQLQQIESHLSKALAGVEHIKNRLSSIEKKLDAVLEKIDAVQRMEAEKDLRSDLRWLLREKHVSRDELNVSALSEDVAKAIERYQEMADLRVDLGSARGLRLTLETRDLLDELFSLFHTLRLSAYEAINREVRGHPIHGVRADLMGDYWPETVASYEQVVLTIQGMHWSHKKAVRKYIGDKFVEIFEEHDPVASRLQNFFRRMDGELDRGIYDAFRQWWVWQSDAGRIYRLYQEAKGLTEGYEKAFGLDHVALDASETDADFLIATPNDDGTAGDMMDTYAGAVGSK